MASYQMQRQVWTRSARHAQTTAACLTSTRSFTSLPPRLHQEGRNFAPSTTTNDFSAIPQQPFAQPPPKPPRRRIGLVSSVIFLLLGGALSAGRHIEDYLPKPAVPGSPEDEKRRARVRQEAEKLPLVQQLMANPACTLSLPCPAKPLPPVPVRRKKKTKEANRGLNLLLQIPTTKPTPPTPKTHPPTPPPASPPGPSADPPASAHTSTSSTTPKKKRCSTSSSSATRSGAGPPSCTAG